MSEKQDTVRQQVNAIRAAMGFPQIGGDRQQSADKCPICGGTGFEWLGFDNDMYSWSTYCRCLEGQKSRKRIEESGLSDLLKEYTFDSFKIEKPHQKEMARIAASYTRCIIENDGKGKMPWLFIGGQPGCGKTHICTAICGKLLEERISVLYMQWLTDARKLKAVVNDASFDAAIQEYINAQVLYIDDLLKQQHRDKPMPTDADVRIAFEIINARYNQNKTTIISSEWRSAELLEVDEATFGRMCERSYGYLLNIAADTAKDMRIAHNGD